MTKIKRPEVLAPAGDFEKLETALRFGADAVYLAGKSFGMRAASDNFTVDELRRATELRYVCGTTPRPSTRIIRQPTSSGAIIAN